MFYKPKFCCSCGEKIERRDWKVWTSRRFCELCETDYKMSDWIPRAVVLIGIMAGVFGLGSYLQKGEKPLNITRNVSEANSAPDSLPAANAANIPRNLRGNLSNASNSANQNGDRSKEYSPSDQKTLPVQLEDQQNPATETVYVCGAKTKKGKPCTRLVKGGGRCWQHIGKPSMVPQEKLLAGK
jgi:hypothetical protein